MSIILDGKVVANSIKQDLTTRIARLKSLGIIPTLATIMVGNDYSSISYNEAKRKGCAKLGIGFKEITLNDTATTQQLLDVIQDLNNDDSVSGILLYHPLPSQIDEKKVTNSISVSKDVDGVNTSSFGAMCMQMPSFAPATPKAILTILDYYNIDILGKHAVVIGRSAILGKPVAMLLLNRSATLTICHSKTTNLPEIVATADILVACIGKAKLVKQSWLKKDSVIIDAGYNDGNVGDVDLDNIDGKVYAYTPVPGGVGVVTSTMVLLQTVQSAENLALTK
ncbi:MAG: bifunctional 5,10-methylenetetrahydrofolate dehydrogenase/5,10-methenyltetrahydrofolate cyclohydrolase [Clostridia bacterium]